MDTMKPLKKWLVSILLLGFLLCMSASGEVPALRSPYHPGPGGYPRFESKQADPGLEYGHIKGLPLPKTLLYSLSADELLSEATTWAESGFQGFFLTGVASEWSVDIWGSDGKPWTIGPSDENFQKIQKGVAQCRHLGCEVFLTVAFSHPFEWFNDTAWDQIDLHVRQFARFARDTGCTGLAIDVEYVWPQYHFNWEGYDYSKYTRRDLVEKIRSRMTGVAKVLYDEFPDLVLLTLPEEKTTLGSHIQNAWIEEAARRNAPGGIHLCTEYTYRRPNIRYLFAHSWLNNRLIQEALSDTGRSYWENQCSIAGGLWPFGEDPEDFHGEEPSLEEFRQGFAASLMVSRRYNWIYSHSHRPFMLGKDYEKYGTPEKRGRFMQVIAERAVVTDASILRTAQDLRDLRLRDYSEELGIFIVPALSGPREEPEVALMPAEIYQSSPIFESEEAMWELGRRILEGEKIELGEVLGTQTEWLLLGPFSNDNKEGFGTVYPPENSIDLSEDFDGVSGKIRWKSTSVEPGKASIDLARVFQPSEEVCAYALCYVTTEHARKVQIRGAGNDQWKMWVGGKPVFECPDSGRVILDREVIPVTLPAGRTPILLKVCNQKKDWGFIFRITDEEGRPLRDLQFGLEP